MLEAFGPSLYLADGPTVSFFGFSYPTRMAVARLSDGSVWVWPPVALSEEPADEVQAIGPVRHIASPNKIQIDPTARACQVFPAGAWRPYDGQDAPHRLPATTGTCGGFHLP